jgi:hypothetical protein
VNVCIDSEDAEVSRCPDVCLVRRTCALQISRLGCGCPCCDSLCVFVCCRRGKSDQKHYTVFICTLTAQDKAAFKPQLNHEHSKWIWWPLDKAKSRKDLHPIVSKLFSSSTNLETVTRWAGLR